MTIKVGDRVRVRSGAKYCPNIGTLNDIWMKIVKKGCFTALWAFPYSDRRVAGVISTVISVNGELLIIQFKAGCTKYNLAVFEQDVVPME
jgi:hypothetical protein